MIQSLEKQRVSKKMKVMLQSDRLITCLGLCILHFKNVWVKISRSSENDPIWVKCASFNPFSGHTHEKSGKQTKVYF